MWIWDARDDCGTVRSHENSSCEDTECCKVGNDLLVLSEVISNDEVRVSGKE